MMFKRLQTSNDLWQVATRARITRPKLVRNRARHHSSRAESSGPRIQKDSTSSAKNTQYRSRLQRLNDKLPRFLQHYTTPLLSAPVSHVTAFLILHELTALVPLVGLAAAFHYSNWLPETIVNGAWIQAGVEKWGRYFERKGWVESNTSAKADVSATSSASASNASIGSAQSRGMSADEVRSRGAGWNVVLEVATAWAVVKALLPIRIVGSVWATPWFARVTIVPIMRIFGKSGSKVV